MNKREDKNRTLPGMPVAQLDDRSSDTCPCLLQLTGVDAGKLLPLDFSGGDILVGRESDADLCLPHLEISRHHAVLSIDASNTIHVRDLDSVNGTFVNRRRVTTSILVENDKLNFGPRTGTKLVYQDSDDQIFFQRLFSKAGRDALTSVSNRNYFMDCFRREWSFARRHKGTLSLVMMDLDHFKRVNDTYGHQVGDDVLIEFASRVQKMIRAEDLFARYGGEEFILLLRDTGQFGARVVAERALWMIGTKPFRSADLSIDVTVSLGVVTFDHAAIVDNKPAEMIRIADNRLYAAKRAGRNRVVDCDEQPLVELAG